jgi:hypothetical protein
MSDRRPSVRAEIVAALRDGFDGHVRVERGRSETRVFPDGFDEPIVVRSAKRNPRAAGGIDVPATYPAEIVAGIRLDVQAILAAR